MKFLFSLFTIVLITKACDNSNVVSETSPTNEVEMASKEDIALGDSIVLQTQNPVGAYYITSLKEADTKSLNLTINFIEGSNKVSGFSGCNHFSGTYTIKKDSIDFGELMSTKMYCEKTQVIEYLMLNCLSQINSFSLKENVLVLKNEKENLLIAQKEIVKKTNPNIAIEYSTLSRGSYKMIQLANKTISVQKSRNSKMITKVCSDDEWNKIINVVDAINLKNLTTLKAPTQARLYDGAAIANLKVLYNKTTYDVPPFDHGKPAKEIEALVSQILSIAGNIE